MRTPGSKPHSLSTSLLAAAAVLALTALLTLVPGEAVTAFRGTQAKPLDWVRLGLFAGSPVWVAMLWLVARLLHQRRQRHVLFGTQRLAWADLPDQVLVQKLRADFPVLDSVAMQIRGKVDSTHDPGGRLLVSPRSYLMRGHRVIVFPAVLWKRLRQNSAALGAVIAHELAHFQYRDMEWLGLARRLLWGVILVFLANYLLNIYMSIQADSRSGFEWEAVQASIVGKAFHFSGLVTLTMLAVYVRTLKHWRETLADFAAVSSQGKAALVSAEHLICDAVESDAKLMGRRLSRAERDASISLTAFHWLLLGAVVVTASTYFLGPFAYLQNFGRPGSHWAWTGEWITGILINFLPYAGFLLLLRVFAEHVGFTPENWESARLLARPAMLLILGGSLGYVLTQTIPLMLSSIAMPIGYDDILKHDPGPLLMSSIVGQLGRNAWHVVLVLLGIAGAQTTGYRSVSWLPGLMWTGLSLGEQKIFPSVMVGGITPLAITLFAVPILVVAYRRKAMCPAALWLPILGLASLQWFGLGDINHLAAVSFNAAVQAEARGDRARAIALHRRAVFHAPGLIKPKLELVRVLSQSDEDLDEAIVIAEYAVKSPLTSSWQDRFRAFTIAADLRLQRRTPLDLVQATHWYARAEWLFRNNARLPTKQVARILYNQACVALLQGESNIDVVAGLLEALALDKTLASDMLQDVDLKSLNLKALPLHNPERIRQVLALDVFTAPRISKLAEEQGLDANQLAEVLAVLARHCAGLR